MTGIERIAAERERQFSLGYTQERDNAQYDEFELALAAVCYALPIDVRKWRSDSAATWGGRSLFDSLWPWGNEHWHPTPEDRIKELAKAGALIAAQIDWFESRLSAAEPAS